MFATFGIQPLRGRAFEPAEDFAGGAPVAIVSDGFWRRELGADPAVLGRTIQVDHETVTVVGVLRPRAAFPRLERCEVFLPLAIAPELLGVGGGEERPLWIRAAQAGGHAGRGQGRARCDRPLHQRLRHPRRTARPLDDWRGGPGAARSVRGGAPAARHRLRQCRAAPAHARHGARARPRHPGGSGRRAAQGRISADLPKDWRWRSPAAPSGSCSPSSAVQRSGRPCATRHSAPQRSARRLADGRVRSLRLANLRRALGRGRGTGMPPVRISSYSSRRVGAGATASASRSRLRDGLVVAQLALALLLGTGAGLLVRSLQRFAAVPLGFEPKDLMAAVVYPQGSSYTQATAIPRRRRSHSRRPDARLWQARCRWTPATTAGTTASTWREETRPTRCPTSPASTGTPRDTSPPSAHAS